MARSPRDTRAEYAARNERARELGLTGYSQLRSLGGITGLKRDFPLSARSQQLIPRREQNAAHRAYIKARIEVARRADRVGNASPLQQRIADSFQRRQTREELNEYGQPAPPPSDQGAVRDMYEWYDDWWGEYDPWDSLDDYESPTVG